MLECGLSESAGVLRRESVVHEGLHNIYQHPRFVIKTEGAGECVPCSCPNALDYSEVSYPQVADIGPVFSG